MKYRIIIFTDSKWRDLPANALLKYQLERAGLERTGEPVSVVLCSYHLWYEAINLFSPHVVVLNHIQGKRNRTIASHVKRHGGNVVVMFNEGIVEFDGKAEVFKSQKNARYVDLFVCWNDVVSELVDGETFGSSRFDFYRRPFSSLIESKNLFCTRHGLDSSKRIIAMGDSWPSAKFAYSLQSFHRSNWRDLDNVLADKWSDADAFAANQYKRQEEFKLYATAIKNEYDAQVVIKMHPMSDFMRWNRWCSENGITLVHGEYIFNVLKAADVYVAKLGSITTAESWLLHKPVIKLGKDYDSASSLEQFDADSHNADNIHELMDGIDFYLRGVGGFLFNDRHTAYLNKWGIQPRKAGERIADRLLDFVDSTPVAPPQLTEFFLAVREHDLRHDFPGEDGFGNWNKAITQEDVDTWGLYLRTGENKGLW